MGIMCVPSLHRDIFARPDFDKILGDLAKSHQVTHQPFCADTQTHEQLEGIMANIAVRGECVAEAKNKLLDVCSILGISGPNYNVSDFLADFK